MGLGRQWEERLRLWDEAFVPNLYQKIGTVELEGFVTTEHIRLPEVKKRTFQPFPEGMRWGRMWEYGWFRCRVILPVCAVGKRIVLKLGAAAEMFVYVNGREAGSVDKRHDFVQLTPAGVAGEEFEIYAEGYAGHGPRLENGGIYPPEVIPVPQPPGFQCVVGESSFGIWNEEMFQAYADYHTLYELWGALPEGSLRGMLVAQALKEFTYRADFELPEPLRTESIRLAGAVLSPLLKKKNGGSVPVFSVFGQSHLDLAWLWTKEETKRKSARTYANQLALMERYPEYRFLLCEPPILEYLKHDYPGLYARVKEKAGEGKFFPDGAMWVEGDVNMAGGESLVRQFVYGKRWFREEFGVDSRVAWMPDTFGFAGSLPQIMKGCGVDYFATQKLLRADPECEPFPYNLFWWEGIDGSKVLAHIFKRNNTAFSPADMVRRWEDDRNQAEGISGMLYPFGYGDGGGGPTELMVEMLCRCGDLEGAPRTVMEGPGAYFGRVLEQPVENVYYGELYLAWHRGTYTAQARIKKKVRQAEGALRQADFLAGLIRLSGKDGHKNLAGREAAMRLEAMWKELLFCEFHDILPGTSIRRVNEQAEEALNVVRREALLLADVLLTALAGSGAAFNLLSWPREYEGGILPPCGYAGIFKRKKAAKDAADGESAGMEAAGSAPVCAARVENVGEPIGTAEEGQEKDLTGTVPGKQRGNLTGIVQGKQVEEPAGIMPDKQVGEPAGIVQGKQVEEPAGIMPGKQGQNLAGTVRAECGKNSVGMQLDNGMKTVTVENQYYTAKVDCLGRITSLVDKESGYEYAAGALNELCMYRDVNVDYDAWELGRMYEKLPVTLGQEGTLTARAEGDGIHFMVYRKEAHFIWQQEIVFAERSRRIEFRTKVDWQERHKLLKAAFPTTVYTKEAIEEIPFGYLKRPTHRSRQYERDLYETCHHRYAALTDGKNGLALLNDCKYGISAKDSTLALTLLRAPVIPDMEADLGEHEFTYALYLFREPFTESDVVREAYGLNTEVLVSGEAGRAKEAGEGEASGKDAVSYFSVDEKNVILETCKPALDKENGVVLRLYECMGSAVCCRLFLPPSVKEVWLCNMLEEKQEEVPLTDGAAGLSFCSFEIKTLLLLV